MEVKQTKVWMAAGAAGIGLLIAPLSASFAADQTKSATTVIKNEHMKGGAMFGFGDKTYTREEIQSAQPLEWTPAGAPDNRYQVDKLFREEQPQVNEPQTAGRPGAPSPQGNAEAKRAFGADWELLKQQYLEPGTNHRTPQESNFADFGTADTYTSYKGNYWTSQQLEYPWKVVGKLLIDGGGYCTAQSITGAPKNILVTAAHCVYDRSSGRFYSGWTFVPAERNGAQPYGQFRWSSARVLNQYISAGGRRYDVAIIRLQNNSVGRPVSFYTGWLGWRQNYPYVASLHSFGYASNISTQWTSMCAAESFFASCEGDDVLVKGCNMTYGASGGGWVDQYKPYEVSGYVEGVVSGPSCAGGFGQTYVSARFSSNNLGVLCAAEGGCTTP